MPGIGNVVRQVIEALPELDEHAADSDLLKRFLSLVSSWRSPCLFAGRVGAINAAVFDIEPMNVGMGGDLFAIIYTAKDHKLHVLNASGKAPSGETIEFLNAHGYRADPANWGPGSGMPQRGILSATVPGAAWGWQEVLDKYGTMTFKDVLEPAATYASEGVPIAERAANDCRLPNAVNAVRSELAGC